jgi:putative transcriptional regulator
MKDELFNELVESVKEGGAYLRGEAEPAAVHFAAEPDPREIRARMGLTQEEFADRLGITTPRPGPARG